MAQKDYKVAPNKFKAEQFTDALSPPAAVQSDGKGGFLAPNLQGDLDPIELTDWVAVDALGNRWVITDADFTIKTEDNF